MKDDSPLLPDFYAPKCQFEVLDTRFGHAIHSYHNESPWNEDRTCLLYTGLEDSLEDGCVVLRELASGEEMKLATSNRVNYHTGAFPLWAMKDQAVVFNDTADGITRPYIVWIEEPGKVAPVADEAGLLIRAVSPGGDRLYAFHSRPDAAGKASIMTVDLASRQTEEMVSLPEVVEKLPASLQRDGARHFFNHPVPNADEDRIFFKLMNLLDEEKISFNSFWTRNLATGELHCLGNRISGHPAWMADGKHIANIKSPWDDSGNRWIVKVNAETGEESRLFDFPIEGPGHLTFSPDGRYLVSDAFTADGRASPVYFLDVANSAGHEVIRLSHQFKGSDGGERTADASQMQRITRGQPHPAFSPDGQQVAVNCNFGGKRFRIILLSEIGV